MDTPQPSGLAGLSAAAWSISSCQYASLCSLEQSGLKMISLHVRYRTDGKALPK